MKIVEVKAPKDYKAHMQSLKGMFDKVITIFLAGAIDMGEAKDWQLETKEYLEENLDKDAKIAVILLNPRRDDWDSSWKQEKENKQFNEQVTWELEGQENADHIFLVFTEESKAPITLLELGLFKDKPMTVVCPKEFYRSGNVDIVCDRYGIEINYTFEDGLKSLLKNIVDE